jgi:hypothetical protein
LSIQTIIVIVSAWAVLTVINYYFMPYFLLAFEWLMILLTFLVLTIIKIIRLLQGKEVLTSKKLVSYGIISVLFIFIIYPHPINKIIEKIDWYIFYNKRVEIVHMVKNRELNPNVSWNNVLCELPYDFPVVSNGGNDILIKRIDSTSEITVTFWIFRNFFSAPSTQLVYTNSQYEINHIQNLIKRDPSNNWEIAENWYRTFDD